jgi:hypothetical protein
MVFVHVIKANREWGEYPFRNCYGWGVPVESNQALDHNVGVEFMEDGSIQVWYLGECKHVPAARNDGFMDGFLREALNFTNLHGDIDLRVWVHNPYYNRGYADPEQIERRNKEQYEEDMNWSLDHQYDYY